MLKAQQLKNEAIKQTPKEILKTDRISIDNLSSTIRIECSP